MLRLLEELGFIINRRKSNLVPCTRGKFLGVIYDSQKMELEVLEMKIKNEKMLHLLKSFPAQYGSGRVLWVLLARAVSLSNMEGYM